MSKPITRIGVEIIELNGLRVHSWTKRCPYCHREYTTTSRTQKFCSDDCCKKYNKRQREQKKRYLEVKPVERLRVRSHNLAVDVMNQLDSMGIVKKACSCCGSTTSLELHHKDLNWLNNTPSNLQWLCTSCHSKEHSRLEQELHSKGMLLSEYYDTSLSPLLKVLNKNLQDE